MTPKRPPSIATWMLQHFGSGPSTDAVLGDLAEQYAQKNSALWYWRQAIEAIPVSLFKEIRSHRPIAARALLTGWVLWILGGSFLFPLAFLGANIGYGFQPSQPIGSAWSFMWMPVLGPGIEQSPAYFVLAVALPLLVGAVSGWLVARLHRDQQTGVVLLFAASILLLDLLLVGPFVLTVGSAASFFAVPLAANVAASILGVLIGGGIFRHPPARRGSSALIAS